MIPERFRIETPQAQLDDLAQRLARTRLPADFANETWRYGTNGGYLADLVAYWRDGFNWRRQEAAINRFHHYRVSIEGIPLHFIRKPARGPRPIPIILTHGWPWTFWDYADVIVPLSDPAAHGGDPEDAFEVIVPSLPGFGYSTPLAVPGINFWRTADLWHRLMTEGLGFPRFAAQGGDWGALVTAQLAHKYAASLYGIHLTNAIPLTLFNHERPWDITAGQRVPDDLPPAQRAARLAAQQRIASHVAVHVLDPQTLAHALNDSPAGLLAWLVERRRAWGDTGGDVETRFSRDQLLTTTMIYWLTESFHTSARFYAEAAHNPWTPSHDRSPVCEAPAGLTLLGGDVGGGIERDTAGFLNLHYVKRHARGGHFAPAEEPRAVVDDIRATFRPLR